MKLGPNIRFKTVLFIWFGSHVFLYFRSFDHFSGPLVFYLFGPMDSVYWTSSILVSMLRVAHSFSKIVLSILLQCLTKHTLCIGAFFSIVFGCSFQRSFFQLKLPPKCLYALGQSSLGLRRSSHPPKNVNGLKHTKNELFYLIERFLKYRFIAPYFGVVFFSISD